MDRGAEGGGGRGDDVCDEERGKVGQGEEGSEVDETTSADGNVGAFMEKCEKYHKHTISTTFLMISIHSHKRTLLVLDNDCG